MFGNQGTQVITVCNIALFGKTESNSTQTGKWVGACPADMKPGDVLSPNGVKINLHAVLESKPR